MKKGNIVKITDTGSIYPSYIDMAKSLGADIDGKWETLRTGSGRISGAKAKILNMKRNKNGNNYVLIEITEGNCLGQQYVIGDDGIEVDVVSEILGPDLFEI